FDTVKSSRAFSAKSGQSEAGSTTTASSGRPKRPPLAFCCSISISMVSFSVVSEIAMVPESECKTPTLIGAADWANSRFGVKSGAAKAAVPKDKSERRDNFMRISFAYRVWVAPNRRVNLDEGNRFRLDRGSGGLI